MCNPINSSPHFPSSPSGSLAGFVYWLRGWKEGDPTGPGRLYNLPLCAWKKKKEKNNSKTLFHLVFSHSDTRLVVGAVRYAAHKHNLKHLKKKTNYLFPNTHTHRKRRAECSEVLSVSLSESGGLTGKSLH